MLEMSASNGIRNRLEQFIWSESSLLDDLFKLKDGEKGSEATKVVLEEIAASVAGRLGKKVARSVMDQKQDQFIYVEESKIEGRHYHIVQEMRDFLSAVSEARKDLTEPNSHRLTAKIDKAQDYVKIRTRIEHTIRALESIANKQLVYNSEIPIQPEDIIVRPQKPFTAKARLRNVLKSLKGYVKIIDPFVDVETLDVLMDIPPAVPIRVLTVNMGGKSREKRFLRECRLLKIERPTFELRKCDPKLVHDRFILDENRGWNSGSSLKDIGKKMSTINRLSSENRKDTEEIFDEIWSDSIKIV